MRPDPIQRIDTAFFGKAASKVKPGYAKYELDSPALIISFVENKERVHGNFGHLGIQVEEEGELSSLRNALAAAEPLELTADHWEILELLRQFYAEFQLSPATRPLIKYTALRLGPEKGNSLHLNKLFNGTPAKLAAKLAGLPRPTNCL